MKDMEVRKRPWVKNAAIIFLAVMLVLTFFSNTIMNRTLPEVAAQYATSGSITARIRGSGSVSANERYEVSISQTRTVSEVRVKNGDEVSTGDLLFTLMGDSEELESTQAALHELELELERKLISIRLDVDYASENREIQRARANLNIAQAALDAVPYSEHAFNQARNALNNANSTVDTRRSAVRRAQADLDRVQDELAKYDINKPPPDPELPPAPDPDRDALEIKIIEATRALSNASNALRRAEDAVSTAQAALDVQQGYKGQWDSANAERKSLQQTLDDMLFNLSEQQKSDGIQSSLTEIELRELRSRLEDKKAEVAELEKDGRILEITAPVSGVITEIDSNLIPGRPTGGSDTPLMYIEVIDRGYTLSFQVSAEQAARVRVGDPATVDRGWYSWGEEITANLSAIRSDPQNPVAGRILVFNIYGDVEGGTQLNLTLTQQSENYRTIVPNSALRSDTNGNFVLLVTSRSSPLGNRYIATRVDVNIIASDDTHTAVSGGLSDWGDFVITTSTRPIDPGMQVRLVDN